MTQPSTQKEEYYVTGLHEDGETTYGGEKPEGKLVRVEFPTQKENWEEDFDERFTNNAVFWSELVSEWHQGDVDVKPFKQFIRQCIHQDRLRMIELLEKERGNRDCDNGNKHIFQYNDCMNSICSVCEIAAAGYSNWNEALDKAISILKD